MPLYMDVHSLDGGPQGKIFCLVDAPNGDAATTVHRKAHGLIAEEIVQEGS